MKSKIIMAVLVSASLAFLVQACDDSSSSGGTDPVCGNGIIERGEECDAASLDDKDCTYFGYAGGVLRCSNTCIFDFASCDSNVGLECNDEGASSCEGNTLLECSNENGRLIWTAKRDCSIDGLICSNRSGDATCTQDTADNNNSSCSNECPAVGKLRCSEDLSSVMECSRNADGCLGWTVSEQCSGQCVEDASGIAQCSVCQVMDVEDNALDATPQSVAPDTNWCFDLAANDLEDCITFEATGDMSLGITLSSLDGSSCPSVTVAVYANGVNRIKELELNCNDNSVTPSPGDALFRMSPGSYQICVSSNDEVHGAYLTYTMLPPPRQPQPGDIMISEVFHDLRGGNEWVEVLNLSDSYLDLSDCTLESSNRSEINAGAYLAPRQYGVLAYQNTPSVSSFGTYTSEVMQVGEDQSLEIVCQASQVGASQTVEGISFTIYSDLPLRSFQVDSQYVGSPSQNDDVAHGCASVYPYANETVTSISHPDIIVRMKGTPGFENHSCTFQEQYRQDFNTNSIPSDWSVQNNDADLRIENGQLRIEANEGDEVIIYSPAFDMSTHQKVVFSSNITIIPPTENIHIDDPAVEIGISISGTEYPLFYINTKGPSERRVTLTREFAYLDGVSSGKVYYHIIYGNGTFMITPLVVKIDNFLLEAQ